MKNFINTLKEKKQAIKSGICFIFALTSIMSYAHAAKLDIQNSKNESKDLTNKSKKEESSYCITPKEVKEEDLNNEILNNLEIGDIYKIKNDYENQLKQNYYTNVSIPNEITESIVAYVENYKIKKQEYEEKLRLEEQRKKNPSLEEKENWIIYSYQLSEKEWKTIVACMFAESGPISAIDCEAATTTLLNRAFSYNYGYDVEKFYGKGSSTRLYYQLILKNQFVVYQTGAYKQYYNKSWEELRNYPGYSGIVKALYGLKNNERMHNYLQFRDASLHPKNSIQYVNGGNRYFSIQPENDRKPLEEVIIPMPEPVIEEQVIEPTIEQPYIFTDTSWARIRKM